MSTSPALLSGKAVLDNSIVLAILMPDEQDPLAEQIKASLSVLELYAPSIWPLEFANALNTNIRRKRITVQAANDYCGIVERWEIHIDVQAPTPREIAQLARDTGLTAYDASYLMLARRLNAPLYTLDDQLAKVVNT